MGALLVPAVTTLLGALIAIAPSVAQIAVPLFQGQQDTLSVDTNLIEVVSSDNALAYSYIGLLGDVFPGQNVLQLRLEDVDRLTDLRPWLVLFGSSNSQPPAVTLSDPVRRFLEKQANVIGVGTLGGVLFGQLESQSLFAIDRIRGIDSSDVQLDRTSESDIMAKMDADQFPIYATSDNGDDSSSWAVYDRGDLRGFGFRGIAFYSKFKGDCAGQLWPVVLHRNQLFWGFATDASNLTSAGRQLFTNLVQHMKGTAVSGPDVAVTYPGFGPHRDQSLTCSVPQNEYRVNPAQPGKLHVRVSADSDVQVTIISPTNQPVVDRVIKKETLDVQVPITGPQNWWRITVSYEPTPGHAHRRIRYGLDISLKADGVSLPEPIARSPVSAVSIEWALAWLLAIALGWVASSNAARVRSRIGPPASRLRDRVLRR